MARLVLIAAVPKIIESCFYGACMPKYEIRVSHIYGIGCSVREDWQLLRDNYFSICDYLIWYELKSRSHANVTSQNSDYAAMV